MDGIINLYKPLGITSARALDRARRITGQRKSGHTGTLDPMAEGVLVLCLGKATKLVELVMDQPKVYRAVARLDVTSESFDVERPLVAVSVRQQPESAGIKAVLAGFEGTIDQVPPATSAVKVGGRSAYKLSRAGIAPVLKPRAVRIYWVQLRRYEWPEIEFETACGRGTYIRALIRDVGLALGTGGCLTSLVRRAVGPFQVAQSWSLERLATAGTPSEYLLPIDQARAILAAHATNVPILATAEGTVSETKSIGGARSGGSKGQE